MFDLSTNANQTAWFKAEQLADRGLAIASYPDIPWQDPLLRKEVDGEGSYEARISSEGALVNLNFFLEKPDRRIVLEELFYQWGLRSEQAVQVVDSLIDWVDEDSNRTGNGAEQAEYLSMNRLNQPFNREFQSLEEVALVQGFELVTQSRPDWRDQFTLLSSGPIDLRYATAEVISAVCQCPLENARLFVVSRETDDGPRVNSVEDALSQLGVPPDILEQVQERIAIDESTMRISSIGRYGSIAVERTITVTYTGNDGTILRWQTKPVDSSEQ